MSARSLPEKSNLEQLKKQAKDLLKAYRSGDPGAVQQFADEHPRDIEPSEAKLTDAQLAISRTYGFESWPRLRREVAGRQLRSAIWNRDLKSVRSAIKDEPEAVHESGPHPRWGGQPTPIQIAAERGDTEVVRMLLDEGASPESGLEGYGWSALQLAAHWCHSETAQLLIERGATVDIFSCALLGDEARATELLTADDSLATQAGLNEAPPLHVATTVGVARCLIDQGAKLDTIDSNGTTPLGSAIGRGERCRPVAEFLLDQGSPADPCILAALGKTDRLSEHIASVPESVGYKGKIGQIAVTGTPLHAAAQHNHLDTVTMLLEHGVDPNARADAGQTPLHLCQSAEVAKALIDAGADFAAVDDEHKTTPLAWAKIGVDINGSTPERLKLVEYLETIRDA